MSSDDVERLRQTHTLQYGWRFGEVVRHTENDPDPNITERMNRCAVCEQWSPCDGRESADEIERLRNRLQACQSNDTSPLTDDCITQNERFLLAENERLRAERTAERAEVERLTAEMHRQHDDAIHWLRAYDAERDAIDATDVGGPS